MPSKSPTLWAVIISKSGYRPIVKRPPCPEDTDALNEFLRECVREFPLGTVSLIRVTELGDIWADSVPEILKNLELKERILDGKKV